MNLKIGLQLYSIRDEMEKDMAHALKAVKEIGYDYVEFAGYFGKEAEQVKALLDCYGLKCISVHQNPTLFFEEGQKAIDYLKKIGTEYCAIPWYEVASYRNDWDKTIKSFSELGKKLKENGIQLLYHNHDFEFQKIGGEIILDKIYQTVPAEYLQPELDMCWVKYAGYEPVSYLEKYAGRIDIVHIKDFCCEKMGGGPVYALIDSDGNEMESGSKEERGFEFRPVGSGIQDVKSIVAASEKAGAQYLIVEQDEWGAESSLGQAKKSIEYLKQL